MKQVNLVARTFPFKTWEAKALGTRLYWKQSPAINSALSTSLGALRLFIAATRPNSGTRATHWTFNMHDTRSN